MYSTEDSKWSFGDVNGYEVPEMSHLAFIKNKFNTEIVVSGGYREYYALATVVRLNFKEPDTLMASETDLYVHQDYPSLQIPRYLHQSVIF